MFEIRKNAAEKIKELTKDAPQGVRLRISIERGCCSDNINMELSQEKSQGDLEIENEGLKYYLSADAAKVLEKAWMDADEKGNIFVEGIGPKPQGHDCCGEHNDDCCSGDEGGCCGK
ncbi:MAG: hypothetical protein GX447_03410 [Elusimicrobia bacterium]|nr:hypothetical protein [Elusimicrobiota bacterium]